MMMHSSILPPSTKIAITNTVSQLQGERTFYMNMPMIISSTPEIAADPHFWFDFRFKEIPRILRSFISTVESTRKPTENNP
jgi:hypothetical protein